MKYKECTLDDIKLNERGSVISGPFGSNISSKFFVESGLPVIRGNNLNLSFEKFIDTGFVFVTPEKADELNCWAIKGDLIFTAAGTIGQVGLLDGSEKFDRYVISNKQLRARIDTTVIDVLYAYYWFSSPWIRQRLQNSNVGSTVPLITLRELKELPIRFPVDIVEQKKIATCLDHISRKIFLNNAINTELESTARTLYDYWFTQFDFPDADGKPYKSSGNAMIWSEELKREIPQGWKTERLKDVADIVLGGTPSTGVDEYWGGEFHWLNSGEVSNFPVVDSELFVTQKGIDNSATKLMPKKTTIISITGNIRTSILAIETCANQSVVGVYETETLRCQYLYPIITGMLASYTAVSTGNCQTHINKGTVEDTKIVIPSDDVLDVYYAKSEPLYRMIFNNALQSKNLIELRDFLLPLLMNGQVRVANGSQNKV